MEKTQTIPIFDARGKIGESFFLSFGLDLFVSGGGGPV